MPPTPLERFAHRATALAERWMPDAFVFALASTLIVLAAALFVDPAMRAAPLGLVEMWGGGFWQVEALLDVMPAPFAERRSSPSPSRWR